MLKKSLIALGVAISSGAVFAAGSEVSVVPAAGIAATSAATIGQGTLGKGVTSFNPSQVIYEMSSAKSFNTAKEISVTLNGGSFGLGTSAQAVLGNSSYAQGFPVASGAASTALAVNYNGTNTSFDLGGLSTALMDNGAVVELSGLEIAPDSNDVGHVVSMQFEMLSALGDAIDSVTGQLGKFVDQVEVSVTGTLGSKVDVAKASKLLVDSSDAISVALEFTPTDFGSLSGVVNTEVTLDGTFGWLYNASNALIATAIVPGDFDFSSAAQKPVATVSVAAGTTATSNSVGVNFIPSSANGVLPTTLLSGSATSKLGSGTSAVTVDTTSGLEFKSWTLNGSDVTIPYMPFGTAYAQSITMTNSGSVVGDITATFTANGETSDPVPVGTAEALSVTNIGPAVADAAKALGLKAAQVHLSVTSPSADIEVVAIYYHKVDGDRVQTYSSNTNN